jgi:hypothetical protein
MSYASAIDVGTERWEQEVQISADQGEHKASAAATPSAAKPETALLQFLWLRR